MLQFGYCVIGVAVTLGMEQILTPTINPLDAKCPHCEVGAGEPCLKKPEGEFHARRSTSTKRLIPVCTITGYRCTIDPSGYVTLFLPYNHAIGKPSDPRYIKRHRYVLWESLCQPTLTACRHCGWELPWTSDLPAPYSIGRTIVVDHLSNTPGFDHHSLLAPSCNWCNQSRNWMEQFAPTHWRTIIDDYRHLPPWDRPSVALILSLKLGIDAELYLNMRTSLRNLERPTAPATSVERAAYTAFVEVIPEAEYEAPEEEAA